MRWPTLKTLLANLVAHLCQLAEIKDLLCRKGTVEDRQLVKITVPHIEISFLGRGAEQIQLGTNREGSDSRISMELLIRLRVYFDAISVKMQHAAIGDKRD